MKTRTSTRQVNARLQQTLLLLAFLPLTGIAQVPVDENGNTIGTYESQGLAQQTGNEDIPLLNQSELEDLVGPIALYPDDLLAVVLPAATYPLQVVQAARFLEDLESDPSLKPDPDWDDSVVALTNYPEVVTLLNEDLDWTWRLGEAVVAQQADVVGAVESFRNRAYAAGNLKSDNYQNVTRDEGIIEITPVNDDIIYVPYYEPRRVIVHQPRPVYYYYPEPCPVYYYPYSSGYAFNRGYFWGVTTAYSIGWASDHLRVFHHSYRGHPYYGRSYWDRWWYRRPTLSVHNTIYFNSRARGVNRYRGGDYWRPSRRRQLNYSTRRITRSTQYPSGTRQSSDRRSSNRVVNSGLAANTNRQRESGRRSGSNRNIVTNNLRESSVRPGENRQTFASNRRERQPTQTNRRQPTQSNRQGERQRQTTIRSGSNRPSFSSNQRQRTQATPQNNRVGNGQRSRQHGQTNRQSNRQNNLSSGGQRDRQRVQATRQPSAQPAARQQTRREESRRTQNSVRKSSTPSESRGRRRHR